MRPGKFRFVEDIATSPSSNIPLPNPIHGPQPGGKMIAPDLRKISQWPVFFSSDSISAEAGET